MSNKSIASKIQGLELRLTAENEHRRREDPLSSNNTMGASVGPHRGSARRPKLMNTSSRNRPGILNLSPSLPPALSHQDSETESRLSYLRDRMKNLTINSNSYPTDIKDLELLGELGNGTCGHVVKMLHKPSTAVIAVKQMRRSGNPEENKRILMDLDIVLRSQCPYIVRCFGCFVTEADVWIFMELMASCFDKILKRLGGPVPEEILGKVTVSTVKALSYLKEVHGVIHRDVKPSNILVDSRGSIKLCDFGISGRLVDSKAKTRSAGCAAYMAPERIDPPNPKEPDYDIRADVWSLGISLVELATGNFPYRDCQNDFEVLSKVINDEPPALPENQSFSPEFRSFVKQCLTKNFSHRPKYNALLQHPFLVKSEESGVRVDQWLHTILPRSEMTPTTYSPEQNQGTTYETNIATSSPQTTIQSNVFINNSSKMFKLGSPQLNGASKQIQQDANYAKPSPDRGEHKDSLTPPHSERSRLNESKKSSQESPDQSFSESSKASCISVDQNSISNSSRTSIDEARTPTDKNDADVETNTNSLENLVLSSTPKHTIEDLESTRIVANPIDKNVYKIHRNYVHTESYSNQYSQGVPIVQPSNNSRNNYTPVQGTPPKEYYMQRGRSLSNTMVYGSDRTPPPRYIPASPNTKNCMTNSEIRNQPFSGGGGGGPPSLESYIIQQDDTQAHHVYPPCTYGSPEVNRRKYYNSRPPPPRPMYDYERSRQPSSSSSSDAHHNMVSPPNFALGGYDSNAQDVRLVSPPCFRNNAPTNYFTSSVYTMSKFGGAPNMEQGSIGYHHNPGGSCSQPASLEAYGDSRHPQYVVNSRPPEKNYSPGLWSPQPVVRRSGREREDRWKNEAPHHPQVAGNTSPIVLQRFYHQQSQRRSRKDLRDGSPSQRSVSRDTSIGRSPEPPRRAHRDPSTGRTEPALPMDQQSLLERLEKERERMPVTERERDLHIPERETPTRQSLRDRESRHHYQQQPDLIRPQHRYERDGRCSHQDSREIDNPLLCTADLLENSQTLLVNNTPKERLQEFNRTRNEPFSRSSRERKSDSLLNNSGDSIKNEATNSGEQRDDLTSRKERFEQKLQERRNNKETYVFPRDRDRKDEPNGDVQHCKNVAKDVDVGRLSPVVMPKHGKGHKDKDEQGWLNSIAGIVRKRFTSYYVKLHLGHNAASSGNDPRHLLSSPPPSMMNYSSTTTSGTGALTSANNGKDNHSRASPRFGGGIPRRIADCDQDVNAGGGVLDKKQEYGHFVNNYRYRNIAPSPPPRRGATESWSLPASPLPARPL